MTVTRLVARPLLASMFVVGGVNALKNAQGHAQAAKPITDRVVPLAHKVVPSAPIPTDPVTLVRINAAVQLTAAAALATGRAPRISAALLAGSLVPTTAAGHRFWEEKDPTARKTQMMNFFKNTSMLGGLMLAAVDTEGQPGMAWRAKRAAKDVRRETRTMAKQAGLEAKLAAKKIG